MNWEYAQPVRIRFGNGLIHSLNDEIIALGGQRGILVTSPSFVKKGMAQRIQEESQRRLCCCYSEVSPNPDVKECDACARMMKENRCDFVVALGGGSVMDCAKAAANICQTDESIVTFLGTGKTLPQTHLPVIAIPTTAGTASEVTSVSVLSDHEQGIKAPINAPSLYARLAIIDPELTYSVPPHMTACTGFDVLCHAIEAYWSRNHQPVCDALAIQATRLVLRFLKQAYEEPRHQLAREKMAEASVIAGLAFALPKTTSSHACSYPLTNLLGIPHGEACALTIDYFIRINAAHDEEGRLLEFAQSLGFANPLELADAVTELKQQTGVRSDLKDYQLSDKQFDQLVKGSQHPNLANNPTPISEEMLRTMYQSMR